MENLNPKYIFFQSNWRSSLLFKARTKSLELNFRTSRSNEGRSKIYEARRMGIDETLHHFLMECLAYLPNDMGPDMAISLVTQTA